MSLKITTAPSQSTFYTFIGRNHPSHSFSTMSELCLQDYLHNHPIRLPKDKMPINFARVKLASWKQTAPVQTRSPGVPEEGRGSHRLSSERPLSGGRTHSPTVPVPCSTRYLGSKENIAGITVQRTFFPLFSQQVKGLWSTYAFPFCWSFSMSLSFHHFSFCPFAVYSIRYSVGKGNYFYFCRGGKVTSELVSG